MSNAPKLRTRRPTGKPPWPMFCIAGAEKTGKSYGVALFSSSDLIDRTFYLELGEGAADQYGAIPGARYEIVEHDGTFTSILEQTQAAVAEPRPNGKPHCFAVDSITELWDLLSDEAQAKANARAAAKAAQAKRPAPAEDVQITMDLWNEAKKKWRRFLDVLRVYDGPVLLLARLELVATVENGKPTDRREWKIRAEKNLAYECDAIVKIYAPQSAFLTGVRSTVVQVPPGSELPLPQFTVDGLLRRMGLDAEGATAPRSYTAPRAVVDEQAAAEPERQAQRERGRSEDEWTTAGPALATDTQLGQLAAALVQVRGATSIEAQRTALAQILGPDVNLDERLSRPNVERALSALRSEVEQQEKLDAQDARKAERTAETAPAGERATPAPSPLVPLVTPYQVREVGKLLHTKRNQNQKAWNDILSTLTRRPITHPSQLTQAEARTIVETLTAEPDLGAQQPATGPTPADPVASNGKQRAMHALFREKGIGDDDKHAFITRVLGHDIETMARITRSQCEAVLRALNTGEVPPAAVNVAPAEEGFNILDALDQMIQDVRSETTFVETQQAIDAEQQRGEISAKAAQGLRERLAKHVQGEPAGVAG